MTRLLLLCWISFAAACHARSSREAPPARGDSAPARGDSAPAPGDSRSTPGRSAPPPAPARALESRGALDALDAFDQRQPLPLLPMMAHHQKQSMRDHLVAVQQITAASAERDFARVLRAARRIAYSEQMGRMCEHMGAAAPGFTEQALAFHRAADAIVEAAERQDTTAVLQALGSTLARCTACHETYKQQVVQTLPE